MIVSKQLHPTHNNSRSRRASAGLAWMAALAAATLLCTRLIRRVEVVGDSMVPAFEPGDRLLVVPPLRIRPGQVVAVVDPRSPGRLMVKRILSVGPSGVDVRGDNDSASTDSRHFGPVPRAHITGWVVYQYGPPDRAGWFPGRR